MTQNSNTPGTMLATGTKGGAHKPPGPTYPPDNPRPATVTHYPNTPSKVEHFASKVKIMVSVGKFPGCECEKDNGKIINFHAQIMLSNIVGFCFRLIC